MKQLFIVLLLASSVIAATSDDAREAYLNATVHVEQMKRDNFPHQSVDDLLKDMDVALKGKNATKLLQTALILNQTDESKSKAQEYFVELELARKKGLQPGQNFSKVVEYSQLIAQKHELAFDARRSVARMEELIAGAGEINRSRVDELMLKINESFASEQYGRIAGMLNETATALEDAKVAASRDRALARLARRNLMSFVEDNWFVVLVALFMLSLLGLLGFIEGRVFYATKKIHFFEEELAGAQSGLFQAQKEYYSSEIGRPTYLARTGSMREKQRNVSVQINTWRELRHKYAKVSLLSRFRSK